MVSSTSLSDPDLQGHLQSKEDTMKAEEERPASPMDASSTGYSSDSSAEAVDVSKLDPATLKARIKAQVEYYFSQQNLNKDAYMISQMNTDGFIAVSTIANFKKVRKLTDDLDLIVEAVADSSVCELSEDKTMLKTSWKRPARTTIILRDVHEEATEEDILALFTDTSYEVVNARSDVGNTWFLTMATEDDATDAILHLLAKELKGQPVKARLKSETLRPTPGAPVAPVAPMAPGAPLPPYAYAGYPGYNNVLNYWGAAGVPAQFVDPSQPHMGRGGKKFGSGMGKRGSGERAGPGDKRGSGRGLAPGASAYRRQERAGVSGVSAPPAAGIAGRKGKKSQAVKKAPVKTPNFKPQDFPSLPMGKISLDDGEPVSASKDDVDETTATEEHETTKPEEGSVEQVEAQVEATSVDSALAADTHAAAPAVPVPSSAGSWAAAVAKTPPTPAASAAAPVPRAAKPAAATAVAAPSADASAAATASAPAASTADAPASTVAATSAPVAAAASSETVADAAPAVPAGDRPKRGWEKPGVRPVTARQTPAAEGEDRATADELAADTEGASESAAAPTADAKVPAQQAEEAAAGSDKDLLKSAFGTWGGQKKSFADVIKTATPKADGAATESGADASEASSIGSESRGEAAFSSSSSGPKVTSLEGNWRKTARPVARSGNLGPSSGGM